MFDDSIGLRLIEEIEERELATDFEAIDLSGNLLNLLSYFNGETERIILVDTAKMGIDPGEYSLFQPKEVESEKELAGISTHEGDVMKIIHLARELNYSIPPLTVFGIEPAEIKSEFGLSSTLSRKVPEYLESLIKEIRL